MNEIPPPSDELISYLAEYDLRVGELALRLREILLNEAPDSTEIPYKSYAVSLIYTFTGRWPDGFCYIGIYSNHVNLGFHRGADLDDPDGILIGDGKAMRHIKIMKPEDLKSPYLKKFIKAAIKNSKASIAAKEKKRKESAAVGGKTKRTTTRPPRRSPKNS